MLSSQGLFVSQKPEDEQSEYERPKPVRVKKDRPKVRRTMPARVDEEYFEDEARLETQ